MSLKDDDQSLFLEQLHLRMPQFKRNEELEGLLDELASYLEPLEAEIERGLDGPEKPPLFLVGNPRSGTSLFMQFLSLLGCFSVPTNLLSRFYYSPFLGAKIQELLTNPKYDYKHELSNNHNTLKLESDIGKAKGMLAPSEYFHFWRRFLPRYDPQYLNDEDQREVNVIGLRKGVAALELVFGRPFAAKAIIMQYNLDLLCSAFPNSLIVYIRRNPKFVMQSIYEARKRFYGDANIWWSVKPKEYKKLKDMDIYHQIAGQVYYTEKAIECQMHLIEGDRKLVVNYEKFCSEPREVAMSVVQKYSNIGLSLKIDMGRISNLIASDKVRLPSNEMQRFQNAYEYFQSTTI